MVLKYSNVISKVCKMLMPYRWWTRRRVRGLTDGETVDRTVLVGSRRWHESGDGNSRFFKLVLRVAQFLGIQLQAIVTKVALKTHKMFRVLSPGITEVEICLLSATIYGYKSRLEQYRLINRRVGKSLPKYRNTTYLRLTSRRDCAGKALKGGSGFW